jgi:hypothetical protein
MENAMAKTDTPQQSEASRARLAAVLGQIEEMGLSRDKGARVTGRINPKLLELARARAGAMSDSQLLEFALANIVIEDGFADAFTAARGKVDPTLDLEA